MSEEIAAILLIVSSQKFLVVEFIFRYHLDLLLHSAYQSDSYIRTFCFVFLISRSWLRKVNLLIRLLILYEPARSWDGLVVLIVRYDTPKS